MSTSTHTRQTHDSGPNTKAKAKDTNDRTCIGCTEAFEKAEQRAQEREKKKIAQPWVQRKMMIFIVLALFGWSSYTFLGVILRRCWQRAPDALVGFVAGIVLTVVYGLLWLMFFLTYLKIIFTPPGFARDYVEPSEPPLPSDPPPNIDSYYPSSFASTRPSHGVVYPPSKQPPASEFRTSLDDRLTHETHSLNDHGEFAITPTEPIGVPYESMPSKPGHKRNASNSAIPPTTPRHERNISTSTSPPSPTTPISPSKPSLLTKKSRKDSTSSTTKPSVLAHPKESFSSSRVSAETATAGDGTAKAAQRPNKLVRSGSVGSRPANNLSLPASPGIPSFSQSGSSPTHRSAPGVRYDSRASEPTRPTPAIHPRMRSYSHTKATHIPSDLTVVHTPSSQTPGVVPSSTHPNVNLAGRTEPYDEQVIPYGNDIPKPYLDDLPPELSRWDRKPSPRPVLDPYQRYCYREGFVKPPRTHHCRICNTCVLGYDHHCPWIGGCVGAQNRKFFVVFVFWCSIYLFYCIGLLIPEIVHHATAPDNPPGTPATFNTPTIDANLIALLVTSGLFCLFSTGMFFTHLHLLCRNASTVEWHTFSGMKEQERAVLSQVIPVCKCLGMDSEGDGGLLGGRENNQPFRGNPRKELGLPSGFKGRRALRKRWDEEWGRIGKEGNLWWLGSNRANWEAVMGSSPWIWFLPVGNVKNVGVHYPVNPRFDPHGRWRRRREWPLELR